MTTETDRIVERYARRNEQRDRDRYNPLNPAVLMAVQERERALARWLASHAPGPASELRVLEVGCGAGRTLLDLLRLGFSPENVTGSELLPDRLEAARAALPSGVRLIGGDAMEAPFAPASFDVVVQSTVFTSILDDGYQAAMARRMWEWVKPRGGVLWYDFVLSNPRNPDVRGVPERRVRELFPDGVAAFSCRVTLAPPIARAVTRLHRSLYTAFNFCPLLRTHLLCWIQKRV